MFDLSNNQYQAASDAMNGVSPSSFSHFIFFAVASIATLWFLAVTIGFFIEVQSGKLDLGSLLGKMAVAMFVIIFVGVLIVY